MSFESQIEGVPFELVQQGFRHRPSEELWLDWQLKSGKVNTNWQVVSFSLTRFCRPVVITQRLEVYSHDGWGEGLAPTLETVEVWRWWWYAGIPVSTRVVDLLVVFSHPMYRDQLVNPNDPNWQGPILPSHNTKEES